MSTKDFIKKSVLNTFTQYDAPKLAFALLTALALGILIYLVYRQFYTGVVYSRSFAVQTDFGVFRIYLCFLPFSSMTRADRASRICWHLSHISSDTNGSKSPFT